MCIICYAPSGVKLPSDAVLERCWDNNPDGGGFMWVEGSEVKIFKSMTKADWLKNMKETREKNPNVPFIFHTRRATHGLVGISNTHPFVIDKHMAMVHNGHIGPCSTSSTDKRSDTAKFAEEIVAPMKHFIFDDGINFLLQDYIGKSKVVFLSAKEGVKIVNEDAGVWDTELKCWFSNSGYVIPKVVYLPAASHKSRTDFREYKEGICPCCKEKTWATYVTLLGMGSSPHYVRVVCCFTCRSKFMEDNGWKVADLSKVVREHDCIYCTKNIWQQPSGNKSDVFYYDTEGDDFGRLCQPCYDDLTTNPLSTDSVWNAKTFDHALNILAGLNMYDFTHFMGE